jgi:hypothetical protein
MFSRHLRWLTLALCAALCTACGGNSTADSSPKPAVAAKPAKPLSSAAEAAAQDVASVEDAEKLTANMVRGVSPGRPTAPVDLKFNISAKPALGVPLGIDLAVFATGAIDSMTLSAQGGDGLEIDAATSLASFPKSAAGVLYRHKLRVTPRAEGAFYVSALVTTVVAGTGPQSRSFAIPLLVGGVAALDRTVPAPNSTAASAGGAGRAPAPQTPH